MLTREELSELYTHSCLTRDGFNLVCLSFNVNASIEDNFDGLLNQVLQSNSGTLPDIFCIGLQEVVPLTAQNIVGASLFSEGEEVIDRWLWVILTALSRIEGQYDSVNGTINPYELLCHEHMVGLWICVIVSRAVRPAIKNIQKAQCQRGVGGMFGNKGAVCVRFDLHDSSICLVNAHFAANRGEVAARNLDFHEILGKEMFCDALLTASGASTQEKMQPEMTALRGALKALRARMLDLDEDAASSRDPGRERDSATLRELRDTRDRGSENFIAGGAGGQSPTAVAASDDLEPRESGLSGYRWSSITATSPADPPPLSPSPLVSSVEEAYYEDRKLRPNDHDVIVFLGDLNYRIAKGVSDETVFGLIEAGRLAELAELDQLNIQKDSGAIFEGFHEGILNFPPTYKFLHRSDAYDRRPDKKARCPAWCDRVLWRTAASLEQEVVINTGQPSSRDVGVGSGSAGYGLPMLSENVELMCYNSGKSGISDHKPVYASLNVKVCQAKPM